MRKFLISPPFGNIFRHTNCTPVVGTYTWEPRGSTISKLYRIVATTRPVPGGWVNNVGLKNSGIRNVKRFSSDHLYSIAAIENGDWQRLADHLPEHVSVELNLSCPNLDKKTEITDDEVSAFTAKFKTVVCKLPPLAPVLDEAERLRTLGVTHIHLFNTISTPRGGESGARLKEYSLAAVKAVKESYPDITVIGGGGVYTERDVTDYLAAGADQVSLASVFFNPIKAYPLLGLTQHST